MARSAASRLPTKPATERAVFLGDWHVPYHDPVAVELVFAFVKWFRPTVVFLIGDYLDCYAVPSRFEKDPQKRLGFQDELDAGNAILRRLRLTVGQECRIVYMDGNHEHRLPRALCGIPEFASLRSLTIPALLGLDDLGIEHRTYHQSEQWHGLHIEHGDRVRSVSGATAKAMLEARGVSGISGHTHRQGSYFKTDRSGVRVWYENGALCRLDPEYVIGRPPNWQQGFSVGYALKGRTRFALEQVTIFSKRLFYAGNLWEG